MSEEVPTERASMADALIHAAGVVSALSDAEFASRRASLRDAIHVLTASLKPPPEPSADA
jgi:hypothetical protein